MTDWHSDIPEEYRNQIVTGDARVLCERIPSESVDLIFTDPVYWDVSQYHWLGREAMRVLKDGCAVLVFIGIGLLPETLACLTSSGLRYRWYVPHLTPGTGGYCDTGPSRQMAMLWLEKGKTKPSPMLYDVVFTNGAYDWHQWKKNVLGVMRWLESFSDASMTILDPFTGGGTVPAVCKMLGRNYIAFEIDPDTAERARVRVEQTQPPLFVMQEEQGALWGA